MKRALIEGVVLVVVVLLIPIIFNVGLCILFGVGLPWWIIPVWIGMFLGLGLELWRSRTRRLMIIGCKEHKITQKSFLEQGKVVRPKSLLLVQDCIGFIIWLIIISPGFFLIPQALKEMMKEQPVGGLIGAASFIVAFVLLPTCELIHRWMIFRKSYIVLLDDEVIIRIWPRKAAHVRWSEISSFVTRGEEMEPVVILQDGQSILIPIQFLPDGFQEMVETFEYWKSINR